MRFRSDDQRKAVMAKLKGKSAKQRMYFSYDRGIYMPEDAFIRHLGGRKVLNELGIPASRLKTLVPNLMMRPGDTGTQPEPIILGRGKAISATRQYGGRPFHVLRDPVHDMEIRVFSSPAEAAAESARLERGGFLTRVQPVKLGGIQKYVIYSRIGAGREKLLMNARRAMWTGGKAATVEEPPASLQMAGSTYYLSRRHHYGPTGKYLGGYRTRPEALAAIRRDIESKPGWFQGKSVEVVWDMGGYHVYVAPRPAGGHTPKSSIGKARHRKAEGR